VEAPGDERLELAGGGALGLALSYLAGEVGLACGVGAEPDHGGDAQRVVEAAVAAGVELHASRLGTAAFDGGGAVV